MAAILNERDIQLQATDPRLLVVDTNYLTIIPSTNTFATTSTGVTPINVDIKSFITGIITGTVSWDTSPTTPFTSITGGIRIAGSDLPIGTSVTVTGSITFLGNVYNSSTVITHAANSSVITLDQTAANINKSSLGVFTPTTVTFSGKISDGTGSPTPYVGRFIVDTTTDGVNYTNLFTSSSNENSYIYTPAGSHKAVRVRLYKAGGTTTLLDEKTSTISESGVAGADGSIYYITPSTYVLAKNANNTFSPANITFNSKIKTGSSPATAYTGRFKIYENGSGIASYTSSSNESSTLYIPTSSCVSIKCELYLAGGTTTLLDTQGIVTSAEGSNGISAILTNEAHVFPASTSGTVSSYTGAGTQLFLYEGGTPIPYDEAGYTAGNPSTWSVTTTPVNISVGTKSDGGNYADFATPSGVASGTDTSSITFNISGRTSIGVAFTLTKVQTFSKSKQGVEGPAGPVDLSDLLVLSAANILTGTIVPNNTGALKIGTITWNSTTGALAGGTGIAITEWGIIGANGGVATFSIQASNGAAIFRGDITGGSNINITGNATFDGSTSSAGIFYTAVFNSSLNTAGGLKAFAGGVNGVAVYGDSTTSGDRGVTGVGRNTSTTGVQAVNTGGGVALSVEGRMTINNTTLVSNLFADKANSVQGQIANVLTFQRGTLSGSGTATFVGTNKPSAGTTSNSWIQIKVDSTTLYIPVWT